MWDTSFLSTIIMWFLNGIIVAVVLAKLFIYGEPVTHKNSEASVAYWRHRNQAEQDSSRVGFPHSMFMLMLYWPGASQRHFSVQWDIFHLPVGMVGEPVLSRGYCVLLNGTTWCLWWVSYMLETH